MAIERGSSRANEIWVVAAIHRISTAGQGCEALTRRACVYNVEAASPPRCVSDRVTLDELERVVRLMSYVNPYYLETSLVITRRGAARSAEQIQQKRLVMSSFPAPHTSSVAPR